MNLTTLVVTCDAYLSLVPNFIKLYSKYIEPTLPIIFVGENLAVEGVNWVLPGSRSWGARVIDGLDQIHTEYVFFLLEDYYLSQRLSTDYLEFLIKFMDREKANKVMLSTIPPEANYKYSGTVDTIKKVSDFSEWLASVQPSIWRVSHLRKMLKPEYSPWDTEILGSKDLLGKDVRHYAVKLDEPIYFNVAGKGGHLRDGWEQFFAKEGLKL